MPYETPPPIRPPAPVRGAIGRTHRFDRPAPEETVNLWIDDEFVSGSLSLQQARRLVGTWHKAGRPAYIQIVTIRYRVDGPEVPVYAYEKLWTGGRGPRLTARESPSKLREERPKSQQDRYGWVNTEMFEVNWWRKTKWHKTTPVRYPIGSS